MTAIPSPADAGPQPERRADPSMEEILASIRKIIADEDGPARAPLRPSIDPGRPRDIESARPAPAFPSMAQSAAVPRVPGQPPFGLSRPAATPPPAPVLAPVPSGISVAPAAAVPITETLTTMLAPAPVEAVVPPVATPRPVPPLAESLRSADAPRFADAPRLAEVSRSREPLRAVDERAASRPSATEERVPDSSAGTSQGIGPNMSPTVGALVSTATTESVASAFHALTASFALTQAETIDRHVRDLLRPMLRSWLDDNLPPIVEKLVRTEIERVARGGR